MGQVDPCRKHFGEFERLFEALKTWTRRPKQEYLHGSFYFSEISTQRLVTYYI